MGYDWYYYLKKAWALYPGVVRPVSATALRTYYEYRRQRRGVARAAIDAFTGLAFHLWVPLRALQVQRRFGHDDGWRRRAVRVAHATFTDPNDIALFRIERPDELATYLRRFENAPLNKQINPPGWTRQCALADKQRFAERCRAAGLPHATTLAVVDRGRMQVHADPAGRELVAKPADGEGGGGVRMLGRVASIAGLRTLLPALQRVRGVTLVQPRIRVHAALRDISLSALSTVRVITMRNEQGAPEVVSATFRCASDPAASVDNLKSGGLIAAVDLDTGRLGVACRGRGGADYTHHPATGAAIEGTPLPCWHEAKELAASAHQQAFSEYVLIGWDVALTPDGPLLIEGNGKPGVLLSQRAARSGLVQGRYGTLLAHHLAVTNRS